MYYFKKLKIVLHAVMQYPTLGTWLHYTFCISINVLTGTCINYVLPYYLYHY